MRAKLISTRLVVWCCAAFVFPALGELRAQAVDLNLETQLLWGTNDKTSPDPKHKPVEPVIAKKLNDIPLKWSHYFVVKRIGFEVPAGGSKRVPLSEKCDLEVKDLGRSKVEVTHFGKGQAVWKGTQALPKGETLVLGGNAPNATSWLVVLKRIE